MRLIHTLLAALAAVLLTAPSVGTAATTTPLRSDSTLTSFAETSVPGVFTVTTSGVGHGSHLGRITLSTTETLDFVTSPGTLLVRDGRLVMVVANGDELDWTYEGTGALPDQDGNRC